MHLTGHLGNAAGQQACFLLSGQVLQEINWFKPEYGSWFIDDRVLQGMSCSEDLRLHTSQALTPSSSVLGHCICCSLAWPLADMCNFIQMGL